MKKISLFLMALSVSLVMFANDKLSAGTQVFLQQRAHAMNVSPVLKHQPLAKAEMVNGKEYIECFIMLDGVTVSELEAMGVEVNGRYNKFVTAKIPVDQIERVAEMKGVKQVVIAHNMRLFTDQAANVTNALKAWDGTNYGLLDAYTGKDVVVGLVDIGIEFNHRAFKDANGNTRVKRVYMPNATTANGGSRPSINGTTLSGYHYTTASQISALTTDYTGESHGTHTSGCATGSKVGNYSGMAPECDIVLCGVGEDGVTDAEMTNCVKYIAEYAKSVGKPCVVSISLGGIFGPHDGTSASCQGYDEVAQEYGAVILLAAGNEADYTAYASKTLSSNNDAMAVIHTPCADFSSQYSNYYGVVGGADFWNSTSDALTVQVRVLNSSGTAVYTSSDMSNGTISASTLSSYFSTNYSQGISIAGAVDAASGRYNLYVSTQLGKNQGSYKLAYIVKGRSGNIINAWTDMQYSEFAASGTVSGYTLSAGSGDGSFGDDITGHKTISVGAMASRLTVPYNNGNSNGSFSNGSYNEGDVAYFSSYGTDCNGVNHPFITAPGHSVVSSINRHASPSSDEISYRYSLGSNTYDYWGYMSGTSMATPISAGVVALYLQADPTLDVDGVKDVIANTATAYSNPQSPAKQRGHGIINALAGIEYIENNSNPIPRISVDPTELNFSTGIGQSSTKTFTVSGRNLEGRVNLTLNDPSGVFTLSQSYINQSTLANGDKEITVTFSSAVEGNFTGSITLTSTNAESKTVTLTASAHDGGTASDIYLDIANYSTIGEPGTQTTGGWNATYVNNLYQYTIDDSEGVAWLTLPVYGAWSSVYYQPKYQNWITTTYNSSPGSDTMGNESWSASSPLLGSGVYFTGTTAKYFGNQSSTASSARAITFYVTNSNMVKLYGKNKSGGISTNMGSQYRCSMAITEVDDNLNQIQGTTTHTEYGGRGINDYVNLSYDLSPEKIYKIEVSTIRTHIYEIGFQTQIPSLTVDPEELDYVAEPGETVTQSFTVTGKKLTNDVTVTLTDDNGVYSIPVTSITKNDAQNGYTVDVTLTAPQTMGSYRGQVTLTSGDLSAEVYLFGSVGEKGTAFSDYLDVGREYESIGLNNWYDGLFAQPYSFTEDETNECAWLTMPAMMSYAGFMFNDQMWTGASQYSSYYSGLDWDPTDVFKGNSYFYGSNTALVMGPNSTSSSNTQIAYMIYNVTNCSQVKAYMYNQNTNSNYPAIIQIYELTEEADGTLTSSESYVDNVTVSTTGDQTIASSELDPNKIYQVLVAGARSFYYEVAFKTPLAAPEATLAEIEGSGVVGTTYTISNELVAVYADIDVGMLWCKDQGNASINPSTILDGQIDFMRDENINFDVNEQVHNGQDGDWDQSNWVALKFPADQNTSSVLTGAVGKKIKAGTVTGRYIDNNNYTIEVQPVNGNYTLTFNGTLEYTPNVYCCANFVESNLNIGGNTGAVGPHGVQYFFMNPKVQEVCEITYAMWDGEMFVTPNNTSIQGAFHVDWSHNSIGAPTLQEGKTYRFKAIVSHPAKLSELKGGGTPSDNYVVYPANLSGDSNIVTAINGVYTDSYRDVVGVEYVNAAGIVSKTPFHGVNIVVTRYSDGSKTTSKKIFK